jgi:hypothetical protein
MKSAGRKQKPGVSAGVLFVETVDREAQTE